MVSITAALPKSASLPAARAAVEFTTLARRAEEATLGAARDDAHDATAGGVRGGVRHVLRLEAAVVLALAVVLYHQSGGGWGSFALLFLVPDVAMLGYLAGTRVGAIAYNTAHSYIGALSLCALGYTLLPMALPLSLIWVAHIAFDRMVGYGLKYGDAFGHTHLGRVGNGGGSR